MLKLTRIFVIAICSIWTTVSFGSPFEEKYDLVVLGMGGLGWFKVQYSGEEYLLWHHWRTFSFEELDKRNFPMNAVLSITKDGQILKLDKSLVGQVSGTQIIDKVFDDCNASGRTTLDYAECASTHLTSLTYQRDGLLTYLKNQKIEPDLSKIINDIEKSQDISLQLNKKMLEYIGENRDRGSRFRIEYSEKNFKILEAQIDQLDFLLSAY